MDRTRALAAVDDAFTEGMRHIFDVLMTGIVTGDEEHAHAHFRTGLESLKRTHEIVTAEVEKTFAA